MDHYLLGTEIVAADQLPPPGVYPEPKGVVYTDKTTVRFVQKGLRSLRKLVKAFDIKVDGVLGPMTKAAVTAFNDKFAWPPDGPNITADTIAALKRMNPKLKGLDIVEFDEDEVVVERKDVVKNLKAAQDEAQAAAEAKAKATTPEQKAAAQAAADAAKAKADAIAKVAQEAPPEVIPPDVKKAASQVASASNRAAAAVTPEAAKNAAAAAGKVDVPSAGIPPWGWAAIGVGGGLGIYMLAKLLLGRRNAR